jgi:hypothetical protein
MEIKLLRFPHKAIRAVVLKNYMRGKWEKAVCFSCGNAAKELEKAGVEVLHIGPHGTLEPRKWFSQAEIHTIFPDYFDATPGNLPIELMQSLGAAYANYLGDLPEWVYVPTGSGETLLSLAMEYPSTHFVAVYNLDEATKYKPNCPLNSMVKLVSESILKADELQGESIEWS